MKENLKVLREKVLSDCAPNFAFWTCHGSVIRNLYELACTIENLNDEGFIYHVNEDNNKNDFAKWILEVIKDKKLAKMLKKIRDKKEYANIIRARINELESC